MLSVITINYNNDEGLERTIASIHRQNTYFKYEHIIIDGASTDRSIDIAKKYQLIEKNVIFFSAKDNGIYNAMNKGIMSASGSHVAFLNSGDILPDDQILEKISSEIENNSKLDLLYGDLSFINDEGVIKREWVAGEYHKLKLYYGWMPPHPMTTVRNSVLQEVGFFNEKLTISADYDLMLKILLKQGVVVNYLPEILAQMELGGISNGAFKDIIKANLEVMKSWVRNNGILTPYWIFFTKPLLKVLQLKG